MQLSDRTLNRTLWVRQQLVPGFRAESPADPVAMTAHLLGLQAQENLSPYLALAARVDDFNPYAFSAALDDRRLVRVLSMRGTVHALTADDALALRPWVQASLDRLSRGNQGSRAARDITSQRLVAAARTALADGPLPVADLGRRLAELVPDVPADALRSATRDRVPLVQVPPRGLWRRSGGVVYELLSTWLGAAHLVADPAELVRRYLRAYGPATAADMTVWSSVTRLGPIFADVPDLVTHTDDRERTLYDVADGVIADADLELPVTMLGNYDNIWLSHADRSRIITPENRARWSGPNGGIGAAVFVDGMFEGVWNRVDGDVVVTPFRTLTRKERSDVDDEIARIRAFLKL